MDTFYAVPDQRTSPFLKLVQRKLIVNVFLILIVNVFLMLSSINPFPNGCSLGDNSIIKQTGHINDACS